MGVLEDITKMRRRGLSDNDIVKNLQDQGISPKAINDALNQADIKKAVSEENQDNDERGEELFSSQSYHEGYGKTQDVSEADAGTYYPPQEQEYMGYESQQPSGYDYAGQGAGFDTSTIIEISEQVFLEKIQRIQSKVDEISNFKEISESRMDSLSERLKKIETIIDNLQIAILEKIGSYGSNLEGIKKEMSMMQDSFGKIAESVSERGRRKISDSSDEEPAEKIEKKIKEDVFSSLKKISKRK